MNILPKKRWHVRTKENIARVRKDEAEAAEKERQEKLRIDQADRERRISLLKQKSKQHLESLQIKPTKSNNKISENITTQEHINLFSDVEHAVSTTNKEHDREVIEKKEEYEKKIGYLTYLGQDTNEALGKKNWYEILPDSSRFTRPDYVKDTYEKLVLKDEDGKNKNKTLDVKDGEVGWKAKQRHDPIYAFRKESLKLKSSSKDTSLNNASSSDHKKQKNSLVSKSSNKQKSISDKELKLKKLREARIKREQQEKQKTLLFLTKLSGVPTNEEREENRPKIVPKYNSQFNPELARQNYR